MKKRTEQKCAKRRLTCRFYEPFVPPGQKLSDGNVITAFQAVCFIIRKGDPVGRRLDRAHAKREKQRQLLLQEMNSPQWAQKRSKIGLQINANLRDLIAAFRDGDVFAAIEVFEVAVDATRSLNDFDARALRPFARVRDEWPILATRESGWKSRAIERLKDIQFGEDTLESRFRKPQGSGSAPREWARRIVETLQANRTQTYADQPFISKFQALARKECPHDEFRILTRPQWAQASQHLKPFDSGTLPDWWKLGKQMLREQCPDFHEHPDWKQYNKRWEGLTKGETQNRILDLVESALERLAMPAVNRS